DRPCSGVPACPRPGGHWPASDGNARSARPQDADGPCQVQRDRQRRRRAREETPVVTSKALSRTDTDTAAEILKSIRTAPEAVRDTALAAVCQEIFTPDELQV